MNAAGRRIDPRYLPLAVMTIGTFMSILDTQIVNIALPDILEYFNATLGTGQLVITGYVMALAVVVPLSGFLGERVGMKRLYMFTLGFFVLGSALCGLAWSIQSLILFRIIQGLGGGMLMPLGMALIFTIITPLERPRFVTLLGIPALMAPLIGPSLGGYMVEYVSWRMIFLINVPVGIIDIFLAQRLLTETPRQSHLKLDSVGFITAAMAFPSLLFAISQGSDRGWTSPYVLAPLAVGATSLGLFVRRELRHHDPMLRIRLFALPMFRRSLFTQWIGQFSIFGLNIVIPLYLERVHGFTSAETGRLLLPMGIAAFISMNIAGRLYNRLGPRPIIVVGLSTVALMPLGWAFIGTTDNTLILLGLICGRGLGVGMFGQIIQIVAYNSIPSEEISRATSLVNVCQRISNAFATATLTTVLVIGLTLTSAPAGASIATGNAPVADMTQAFHYAFLLMTALCIVGIGLALGLRDKVLEESKGQPVPTGAGGHGQRGHAAAAVPTANGASGNGQSHEERAPEPAGTFASSRESE